MMNSLCLNKTARSAYSLNSSESVFRSSEIARSSLGLVACRVGPPLSTTPIPHAIRTVVPRRIASAIALLTSSSKANESIQGETRVSFDVDLPIASSRRCLCSSVRINLVSPLVRAVCCATCSTSWPFRESYPFSKSDIGLHFSTFASILRGVPSLSCFCGFPIFFVNRSVQFVYGQQEVPLFSGNRSR